MKIIMVGLLLFLPLQLFANEASTKTFIDIYKLEKNRPGAVKVYNFNDEEIPDAVEALKILKEKCCQRKIEKKYREECADFKKEDGCKSPQD